MAVAVMMKEPKRNRTQKELQKLTAQTHLLIPSSLEIDQKLISIVDAVPSIALFREQKEVLERFGMLWPSVRLIDSLNMEYWVPLNLAESHEHPRHALNLDDLRAGVTHDRVINKAERVGFKVKVAEPKEMDNTFTMMLGKIISERPPISGDSGDGPPDAQFSVITRTDGVEVLFAEGYFVSTQQGFGFSTPASRRLPWGQYIFGTKVNGTIRFDETLWKIPDVDSIRIEV